MVLNVCLNCSVVCVYVFVCVCLWIEPYNLLAACASWVYTYVLGYSNANYTTWERWATILYSVCTYFEYIWTNNSKWSAYGKQLINNNLILHNSSCQVEDQNCMWTTHSQQVHKSVLSWTRMSRHQSHGWEKQLQVVLRTHRLEHVNAKCYSTTTLGYLTVASMELPMLQSLLDSPTQQESKPLEWL